ncbi:MAG: alanine racemase [Planctomycetes bacterium]|nr:alanine racemase [Planctomycetota bacterium]
MERNLERMRAQLRRLGVRARPHVKTCKSTAIGARMADTPRGPITVSTLAEAERFFAAGFVDVLYAVGLAPNKLDHVLDLRARGCDLTVVVDNVDGAAAIAARRAGIPALLEIDADDHRAGIRPHSDALLATARALADGGVLRGVMTHAGASYACRSPAAIAAMAAQERDAVVTAAARLRAAGHQAAVVSVGSTPTALFGEDLTGVTEVRAGVYVFMDLVMVGLSVCTLDDVALSVLCAVIGHQRDKNWLVTDGGWMALSRDRGTAALPIDQGYGVVCDQHGVALPDLVVHGTNQEHGLVARRDGGTLDFAQFPVGTLLRVLPNHACATAAQHDRYHLVRGRELTVHAVVPRFSGW